MAEVDRESLKDIGDSHIKYSDKLIECMCYVFRAIFEVNEKAVINIR